MEKSGLGVCLLNDSFPPLIDGVANAVLNYANIINEKYGRPVVATPKYPKRDVSVYPYPVLQYTSFNTTRIAGYRMGNPIASPTAEKIAKNDIDIIHSHCPAISTFLARLVREKTDAPIVFTYHTKFNIDIEKVFSSEKLREISIRLFVNNLEACDEVWTVSRGAIENMRSLGFCGDVRVMRNGVDLPRGRASGNSVENLRRKLGIPNETPVFLYVGRMMWYKGLRITLDALAALKEKKRDFRAVFVGSKGDFDGIVAYAEEKGLTDKCLFVGAVYDRGLLRAYYSLADLFLFPSTFDTNGIVVREAAACGLASVLVKGSCAAEDVTDGRNALLTEENAASMAAVLAAVSDKKEYMRKIGDAAMTDLYVSWEDAVAEAVERYHAVLELKKCGKLPRNGVRGDEFLKIVSKTDSFFREGFAKMPRKIKNDRAAVENFMEKELEEIKKEK